MEVSNQPKLIFHGVDILNLNFFAKAPRDKVLKIDVSCDPRVFYPSEDETIFKIIMDLIVKDERFFELTLRAIGNFKLNLGSDINLRSAFVNVNAPAIMFPYVRSFISTLTANMGHVTGTLIIPTQFFRGNLEEITDKD